MTHSAVAPSASVQSVGTPGRAPGPQGSPWWRVSWSVPAAMRAVRATIVIPLLFALTFKVIGDAQMTLFAVFGELCPACDRHIRRQPARQGRRTSRSRCREHPRGDHRHAGQRFGLARGAGDATRRVRDLLRGLGRTQRRGCGDAVPLWVRAADRVHRRCQRASVARRGLAARVRGKHDRRAAAVAALAGRPAARASGEAGGRAR